jgi:hypothetical protein
MPCSDSSSGLNITLDARDECFIKFSFAKITCSSEITAKTGLSELCRGKSIQEILDLEFAMVASALGHQDEEVLFILYLELDALKAGMAQYLGVQHPSIDPDRCQISAIEYSEETIEICEVILPPKELPKILPCSLKDQHSPKRIGDGSRLNG